MSKKVYVGNLPFSVTSESLGELFSPYGEVVSAKIVTDRFSGKSKGFGFVEMSSEEEAKACIGGLHLKETDGRALTVAEARPQDSQPSGSRPPRSNHSFDQDSGFNDFDN